MIKNLIDTQLKLFREKFVNETVKQVDRSNSIALYPWKNTHSHQSIEVEAFLKESMLAVEIEVKKEIKNSFWKTLSKRTYADAIGDDVDVSNCLQFKKGESWETIWNEIINSRSPSGQKNIWKIKNH